MTEYIKKVDVLKIVKHTGGDYAAVFAQVSRLPVVDVDHVMGAVEYLRAARRLCDSQPSCADCEFSGRDWELCPMETLEEGFDPEKAVEFVKSWADRHPEPYRKTRLQDFLEKFPSASMVENGLPAISYPQVLGYCGKSLCDGCELFGKGRLACWNVPLEQEEET